LDALVFEGGPFPFFRRRQSDDNAQYKARRAFWPRPFHNFTTNEQCQKLMLT
jgi:hypothetical protein